MSVRPQIPAVEGVQDKQVAGILGPMKMILESITGRLPNRTQITALNPATTFSGIVNKVNEIIGRLQGTEIATAQVPSSSGPLTNALTVDVSLNNTANYFDGPILPPVSSGPWFVFCNASFTSTAPASQTILVKLWDGTNIIASGEVITANIGASIYSIALAGPITNPSGNLRISARCTSDTTGVMKFNASGNAKDCTITAFRI